MNAAQSLVERAKGIISGTESSQLLIAGFAVGLNLILVAPDLMPAFAEINPYDEAKYIESGSRLLDLQVREQAWGPLVAVPYSLLHLLFGSSPSWFVMEAWGGRFLLFIGLWISTLYLSVKIGTRSLLLTATGVLFVTYYFIRIVPNQSDALFVILSALTLAKLISFHMRHRLKDIWQGSIFVALAALTRTEAILLVPLYIALILVLGSNQRPLHRLALKGIIPSLVILGAFALVSRVSGDSLGFSIGSKAYESFEWNQSVLTNGNVEAGRREAQRLFGTAEENQGSIIRAISRNPMAFVQRIVANAKTLPDHYFDAFGKRLGPMILLFAGIGSLVLIRTGSLALFGIITIWAIQPFVALGFLSAHIVPQIGYIFLILAAVGICDTFGFNRLNIPKWGLIILAILISIYALLDRKPALLPGSLLLASVVVISWIAEQSIRKRHMTMAISSMLALAAVLILRGPFAFPNFPMLGASSGEAAIYTLQRKFPAGSRVLAQFPGPVIAARMELIKLPDSRMQSDEIVQWLSAQDVRAIYIDTRFPVDPSLQAVLSDQEHSYLKAKLEPDDGLVQLFLLD